MKESAQTVMKTDCLWSKVSRWQCSPVSSGITGHVSFPSDITSTADKAMAKIYSVEKQIMRYGICFDAQTYREQ